MAAPSRSKGLILKSVDGISAQIVGRVCDLVTSTAFHALLLVSCVTYVREFRVEISQFEYLLDGFGVSDGGVRNRQHMSVQSTAVEETRRDKIAMANIRWMNGCEGFAAYAQEEYETPRGCLHPQDELYNRPNRCDEAGLHSEVDYPGQCFECRLKR